MNNKPEIRKIYKQKRALLDIETIENESIKIANLLLQLPIWDLSVFHVFMSIEKLKEVDTSFIINILMGKDKEIVIPRMNEDGTLTHFLLTDNTKFKLNTYDISEPQNGIQINENQIDVVFVPLLAYDILGNRIGYGKGFYDQFLKKCKPEVIKIGLSFFSPEPEFLFTEDHDIKLDYVVTPNEIFNFM